LSRFLIQAAARGAAASIAGSFFALKPRVNSVPDIAATVTMLAMCDWGSDKLA
jgi:hypothetical protein